MRTSFSAPNKASEDIKSTGQNYASGTGHHMKSVAKKCKYSILLKILDYFFRFLIRQGLKQN
jgi:hypothetical protein